MRSTYFLQLDRRRRGLGETSKERGADIRWRRIWELEVPNMVKIFLWKAADELLPTRKNLYQKKIVEDPYCLICLREEESFCMCFENVKQQMRYGLIV